MKILIPLLIALLSATNLPAWHPKFRICKVPSDLIESDCGTTFYLPSPANASILEYGITRDYALICINDKVYRLSRIDDFSYCAKGIRVIAKCRALPPCLEEGENPDNIEATQFVGTATFYFHGSKKTIKICAISGC